MALCFLCVLLPTALGHAQQPSALEAAVEAYREGQLTTALERFGDALQEPGNGPAELARIHLHLGLLRALSGDRPAAEAAFAVALAIDPETPPPPELNPSLRELFDAVARTQGDEAMGVVIRTSGPVGNRAPSRLRVHLEHAPRGAVQRLRVTAMTADGSASFEEVLGPRDDGTILVPPEAWHGAHQLTVRASARDRHGGTLASQQLVLTAASEAPALLPAPRPFDVREDPAESGGLLSSPWFWLGVTVVAAGATAATLWLTAEDRYVVGTPRFE